MNTHTDFPTQYTIKQGKLICAATPKRNVFLRFFLFLFFAGTCTFGGYMLGTQQGYISPEFVLIAKDRVEHYKEAEATLERTLALNIEKSNKDYVLSLDELKRVFHQVFPEVKIKEDVLNKYLVSSAKWGSHHSIPPLLVLSIIWRESFFDASTVSTANARGPMQVIYKYHKEKLNRIKKGEQDLHTIDTGIRIGVEVLREYFDRNNRNIFKAMTAYVGGVHRTYAQDILTRYFNARIYVEEQLALREKPNVSSGASSDTSKDSASAQKK